MHRSIIFWTNLLPHIQAYYTHISYHLILALLLHLPNVIYVASTGERIITNYGRALRKNVLMFNFFLLLWEHCSLIIECTLEKVNSTSCVRNIEIYFLFGNARLSVIINFAPRICICQLIACHTPRKIGSCAESSELAFYSSLYMDE